MEQKLLKDISERIALVRNISCVANVVSFIQLVIVVVIPDILDAFVKTWLVVIVACVLAGFIVTLILSRKDASVTLFLSILSMLIAGIVTGIAVVVIFARVNKNGRH